MFDEVELNQTVDEIETGYAEEHNVGAFLGQLIDNTVNADPVLRGKVLQMDNAMRRRALKKLGDDWLDPHSEEECRERINACIRHYCKQIAWNAGKIAEFIMAAVDENDAMWLLDNGLTKAYKDVLKK